MKLSPSPSLRKFDLTPSSVSFSLPAKRAELSQSLTHSPVVFFQGKPPPGRAFLEAQARATNSSQFISYKSPVNNIFNINVNSNVTLSSP